MPAWDILIHEGHEVHEDRFYMRSSNLGGLRDLRGFGIYGQAV